MSASPVCLRLERVSKSYGPVRAVHDVTLDIERGTFFSLLGPSGCGKSTLMRLIAGFETADAGAILLEGAPMNGLAPHLRPVNMMFQSYALFPHLTVADNIGFGLRQMGLDKGEIAKRVDALLERVQLQGLGRRKPDALSGGQKQRVALARALARQPKLLLLDEPLGALDKALRRDTQRELKRIQQDTGTTFVVVTHDQEEAMALSDRVAVMRAGQIEQVGRPVDLYNKPASRFVAGVMGEANFLALPASQTDVLMIRPEHLVVGKGRSARADHWLAGTVLDVVHLGVMIRLHLKTVSEEHLEALIPASAEEAEFAPGDSVQIGYRMVDAHRVSA